MPTASSGWSSCQPEIPRRRSHGCCGATRCWPSWGSTRLRSTIQARIAQTHGLLNDTDSARRAVQLAERLSAAEDILNFAITHRVRARLALSERNPRGSGSLGEQRGGARVRGSTRSRSEPTPRSTSRASSRRSAGEKMLSPRRA